MIEIITLFSEIYYNSLTHDYIYILTLNKKPKGPLSNYINTINLKNPSSKLKLSNTHYCTYAINSNILNNSSHNNICTLEDFTNIYEFLLNNNYTINNELTNLLNNLSNNTNNNNINLNINSNNNRKILFTFNYNL